MLRRLAFLFVATLLAAVPAVAQEVHLAVIVGLAGEPEHRELFQRWASTLVDTASGRLGVPRERIVYLAEQPDQDAKRATGKSTKQEIEAAFGRLAKLANEDDVVFVVLIGHGTFDGKVAKFNVPGPDLTPADFAPLLKSLRSKHVVFVNTASASGDFVKPLIGSDRTIVTATKSASERNETAFARHFVDAFAKGGADADKDQRVSVLEAFEYARREVQRFYEKERRLLTEHAVLEDGREGALARRVFLGSADGETPSADAGDPTLLALRQERRDLERRLDALKARKETTAAELYEEELAKLLLELALKDEEIRRRPADKRP